MSAQAPIRLALIGAGTFARKAHVPSLLELADRIQIVAVCSRSHDSAHVVAEMLPNPVTIYDDIPSLLALEELDAVDVILPIPNLPDVVAQALAAGKHVISEKPIAPRLSQAREMIRFYENYRDRVWMVAENWRYEEAYHAAGEAIRAGDLGTPLFCHWSLVLPVLPDAPYHKTEWRRANRFPGGFLLDGGVHHVAALRAVVGEIEAVTASVAAYRTDLPPADTLAATLTFANGATGSYGVTYAAASGLAESALHVVGSAGSLRVTQETLTIWREDGGAEWTFPRHRSVVRELAAFADAIQRGRPHRNSPGEALRDLAVVETVLAAARTGVRQRVRYDA